MKNEILLRPFYYFAQLESLNGRGVRFVTESPSPHIEKEGWGEGDSIGDWMELR